MRSELQSLREGLNAVWISLIISIVCNMCNRVSTTTSIDAINKRARESYARETRKLNQLDTRLKKIEARLK